MKKKWHKLLVARMVHVSAISRPCFYTLLTGCVWHICTQLLVPDLVQLC